MSNQYCTFYLDGNYFGVDVQQVQEIIRYHDMTDVPLAPKVIAGLINLRGQIVTAIDLRQRLMMTPRAAGTQPMNIVVQTEEGAVSLLVDEIGDVIEAQQDDFEGPPGTLQGIARELITGTYKLENKLLLVLDVNRAIRCDDERLH